MKRRIYVAGGSSERLTVARTRMAQAVAAGWELTHDWTQSEGYDRAMSPLELRGEALKDIEGIRRADVVWFLWPEKPSEGMCIEFGITLAHIGWSIRAPRAMVVSGPFFDRCLFALLPVLFFDTHDHALEYLRTRD